ncbi:MAG: SurA N-terminal domain-containing protein [Candidatus Methylacidiphilales bacterium]
MTVAYGVMACFAETGMSPVMVQAANPEQADLLTANPDGLAATVNHKGITNREVLRVTESAEQRMREQATKDGWSFDELMDKISELRTATLDSLINKEMMIQEFDDVLGAVIPEVAMLDHVQRVVNDKFEGDRGAFIRELGTNNLTLEDYIEIIRRQFIVSAMSYKNLGQPANMIPQGNRSDEEQSALIIKEEKEKARLQDEWMEKLREHTCIQKFW